jgi:hypothetical protein
MFANVSPAIGVVVIAHSEYSGILKMAITNVVCGERKKTAIRVFYSLG